MNTCIPNLRSMVHEFCVSRDGDEVFLCGDPRYDGPYVIQRYNKRGQLLNTWNIKCGDGYDGYSEKKLLHLSIDDMPYIATSCWQCKSISLYSMTDSEPITAYSHSPPDMAIPCEMCHGPDNTILACNKDGNREVLVYDVKSTNFTLKDRIPLDACGCRSHIHYMETDQHGGIVIVASWELKIMIAHSIESKKLVWKIEKREIDGEMFQPTGICSDRVTGALYVGDRHNRRLLVIEPNTGEVRQSIKLPGVGYVEDIAWCNVPPHLVIFHGLDHTTYYNIT